jgi:hypothetical protein
MKSKRDVTFAELRDDDQLVDLNGVTWDVSAVSYDSQNVSATITSPDTGKTHRITKVRSDPAGIIRDWPDNRGTPTREFVMTQAQVQTPEARRLLDSLNQHDQALAAVEQVLGGEAVTDVTAAEQAAADAATEEKPAVVPMFFADMTDLERRSHYHVLHTHGVWVDDSMSRADLIKLHAAAHEAHDAGELKVKGYKPHVHEKGPAK